MLNRTANRLWMLGLIFTACLTAVLGALATRYAFDFSIGQFVSRAPLWILTLVLGGIATLCALLYPIFALRKKNHSTVHENSSMTNFAVLFAASALAISAASTLLQSMSTREVFPLVKSGFAVLAALHFLALFLRRSSVEPCATGLAAMATLWATAEGFYAYFNPAFNMASPFRTFPQLPCVALAFLFLCEAKNAAKTGKYLSTVCAAAISGVLSISIGGATVLAHVLSLNRTGIPVTDGLWMIALGIYGFTRAGQLVSPTE